MRKMSETDDSPDVSTACVFSDGIEIFSTTPKMRTSTIGFDWAIVVAKF
jgi:hypothetical protein